MAQANHRINIYLAPIDQVLSELELGFSGNDQKILCALRDICHSETTDRESISRVAKKRRRDFRSQAENVREFLSFARIRLHDCSRNAGDNAREWSFWYVFIVF